MKQRQIKKEETEFYKNCPYCKKEIKGKTKSQVVYNLSIHVRAKHKNKSVKLKKIMKGGKNDKI